MIELSDKLTCLDMVSRGFNSKEIYDEFYSAKYPDTKYETFRANLKKWKKKALADPDTLFSGTYPDFIPHGATVQVNGSGKVVQAWIKQHGYHFDMDKLLDHIKKHSKPIIVKSKKYEPSLNMLEVPLYDMHFPLSDYKKQLSKLIYFIDRYHYDEINLVIGQDLLHNDDFRGRTSSGRSIQKIDMVEAWDLAEEFWCEVIYHSLDKSNRVNLIYSKGNHDESLAWAFVKRLEALFPDLNVDDTLDQRKCIHWNECFIGITHGHMKKNSDSVNLRGQFISEFPMQFANSKVREIHAGHLHHEESEDKHSINVRRLSSAVPTDEWHDDEGYIGAHKRFMIFEWTPGELDSIHFI